MHTDSHGRRLGQDSSRGSVVGRDHYGVFPLRGKMLNVREASHKQVNSWACRWASCRWASCRWASCRWASW